MTAMKDPVRLSLSGSSDVQDLLRAASGDGPTPTQLDRLAARLAPTVMAPAAGSSVALWIAAGLAVIGIAGAVFWLRGDDDAKPAPAVTTPAPVIVPVELPSPPSRPAAAPAVVVEERRADPVRAQPKKNVAEPVTIEEAPKPREIDLLGPAHQALRDGNAPRALELATRHAELYATGAMMEEREAIAIEALHVLGRSEAGARFKEFLSRFPRSGYRSRLERLVIEPTR